MEVAVVVEVGGGWVCYRASGGWVGNEEGDEVVEEPAW